MVNSSIRTSIRMIDIAQEAGVSRSLVSAVLTGGGKGTIRVSSKTADRIREIASKYHFSPNTNAQMLAGKSSKIIGVLVDSHADKQVFEILSQVEELLGEAGYCVLVAQAHNNEAMFVRGLKNFSVYQAAGIIALAHSYPLHGFDLYEELSHHEHVILVGRPLCPNVVFPTVEKDLDAGILTAVTYLYSTGCHRIVLRAGKKEYYDIPVAGYRAALSQVGLTFCPELVHVNERSDMTFRMSVKNEAERLIADHADGIITSEKEAAVLSTLLPQMGVAVPEELSIVSFDRSFISEELFPGLSGLEFSTREQAVALVARLLELIEKGKTTSIYVKPRLVLKQTTRKRTW